MPANKSNLPPEIQKTRDYLETGGGNSGGTDIKQIDGAMFPGTDDTLISLLLKSNLDPAIDRDVAWLLSEGVSDGEIDIPSLKLDEPSVPTIFTAFKIANSYAVQGKARAQLVEVLSMAGRSMGRFRRMFGRGGGGGYEGGRGFNE